MNTLINTAVKTAIVVLVTVGILTGVAAISQPAAMSYKKKNLAPIDYGSDPSIEKNEAIIELRTNPGIFSKLLGKKSTGFCSGTVISNNYILTAGHCLRGAAGDSVNIQADGGEIVATGVVVSYFMHSGVDLGLVEGDFKTFKKIPVANKPSLDSPAFLTCGYPGAGKNGLCFMLPPVGPAGFSLIGRANLVPGMSGGPLINLATQELVGVNSAQDDKNTAYFSHTIGAFGFLGLE